MVDTPADIYLLALHHFEDFAELRVLPNTYYDALANKRQPAITTHTGRLNFYVCTTIVGVKSIITQNISCNNVSKAE